MGASPPALTLGQRARRALDQLVAYLPVLLMGALAMLTYWLVRHTPELVAVQETRAANHVPDYFMRDFSLKVYTPDGRLEFRVQGEHAQHFPDTDTLEVIRPRLTKLDEAGREFHTAARQFGVFCLDGTNDVVCGHRHGPHALRIEPHTDLALPIPDQVD